MDHPERTKCQVTVHSSRKGCAVSPQKNVIPKLVTSKELIMHNYPDVFQEIGRFPDSSCHTQLDLSVTPKQTPCCLIPVQLKEAFQEEVDKMLQAGALKPYKKLHHGSIGLYHSDHDQALTTLLKTARGCNVQLNYDKLQYKKQDVDFFGEIYMASGHKPAQSKVSSITPMPALICKKDVQSYIGMINYLSKFSA